MNLAVILISTIWWAGTLIQVYRLAHYYQIEEYKSGRFLLWMGRGWRRWLPPRSLAAVVVGLAGSLLDTIPGQANVVALVIAVAASGFAVWPASREPAKKAFVPTPRAMRMIVAGGVLVSAIAGAMAFAFLPREVSRFVLPVSLMAGLLLFLAAPAWLMLGNTLMQPVEALLRRRFIAQAKTTLARIDPIVIGITGSYGKTTTKVILHHLLSQRYNVYATPKSYNTMMGLCLAINNDLADDYSIEYFIAEMGMYTMGEIRRLTQLTPPDIGIMIDVGPQHLERAGSMENIARAKYELIEGLPPDGLGIFNWDNSWIRRMIEREYPQQRIAVSKTVAPDAVTQPMRDLGLRFIATDIVQTLDGLHFTLHDVVAGENVTIQTPLLGEHNVTNIMLATAVALHTGISLRDVAHRARTLQPAESRLVRQLTASNITIINDGYSANPVGAKGALELLGMYPQQRVLVTPGMVELGSEQEAANTELGRVAAAHATEVFLVNEALAAPIAAGLSEAGFPAERVHRVASLDEAISWYQTYLHSGDVVLFLNDLPDTY